MLYPIILRYYCLVVAMTAVMLLTVTEARTVKSMLLDRERKIIMDWTPRAACTLAVEMFLEELGIHKDKDYTGFVHVYRSAHLFPSNVTESMLINNTYYKFKVVRNPYDRVISSYLHMLEHEILRNNIFQHIEEYKKDPMGTSFRRFLDYFVYTTGIFIDGGHFKPQSSDEEVMLYKAEKPSIFNRIVKVENANEGLKLVNEDFHTNYSFPVDTIMHHHNYSNISSMRFAGDMSFRELMEESLMPLHEHFYDRDIKSKVEKIFAFDLLLYNYSYPYSN